MSPSWKNTILTTVIVVCITVFVPVILNDFLLIKSPWKIVGDSRDWLLFWGSFLSSLVTFAVLCHSIYIQRKLKQQQLNLIKKDQMQRELDNFKLAIEKTNAFLLSFESYKRKIRFENINEFDIAYSFKDKTSFIEYDFIPFSKFKNNEDKYIIDIVKNLTDEIFNIINLIFAYSFLYDNIKLQICKDGKMDIDGIDLNHFFEQKNFLFNFNDSIIKEFKENVELCQHYTDLNEFKKETLCRIFENKQLYEAKNKYLIQTSLFQIKYQCEIDSIKI